MIVTALSKFGFLLYNNEEWIKCDKSFLTSNKFKSLKKGDNINNFTFNQDGFLLDFDYFIKVLNHKDKGEEVTKSSINISNNVSHNNVISSCKPSLPFDSIRYAQCVNIAFESFSKDGTNLLYQDMNKEYSMIIKAFDLADKIYIEFNKRFSR